MENLNDRKYLEDITLKVTQHRIVWRMAYGMCVCVLGGGDVQLFGALNEIEVAPGVAVQTGSRLDTPPVLKTVPREETRDPDTRDGVHLSVVV